MKDEAPAAPQGQRIDPAQLEKHCSRLIAQLQQGLLMFADIVDAMRAELLKREGKNGSTPT